MFTIQKPEGSITNFQMKKEIAGLDARTILKTNMIVAERKMNNHDKTERKYIDQADARREYLKNKKDYDRTCPETLDINTQNAMWKRARELKDRFVIGMLSKDELHPIKSISVDGAISNVVDQEKIAMNRSVERNTKWYNANQLLISEFKNIMRHLCPDDPGASDIEKYRPRR